MFARHLHGGFRADEFLHLPGVIFREIDGLADVSVGFGPGLRQPQPHQPGIEIELSFTNDRGGADDEFDAAFYRDAAAPFGEERVGVLDGSGSKLGRGLVMLAHHFQKISRG